MNVIFLAGSNRSEAKGILKHELAETRVRVCARGLSYGNAKEVFPAGGLLRAR